MILARKILKDKIVKLPEKFNDDIILSLTDNGELFVNTKTGNQLKISDIERLEISEDFDISTLDETKLYVVYVNDEYTIAFYNKEKNQLSCINENLQEKVFEMNDSINLIKQDISLKKFNATISAYNLTNIKLTPYIFIDQFLDYAEEKSYVILQNISVKTTDFPVTDIEFDIVHVDDNGAEEIIKTCTLTSSDKKLEINTIGNNLRFNDGYFYVKINKDGSNHSNIIIILSLQLVKATNAR